MNYSNNIELTNYLGKSPFKDNIMLSDLYYKLKTSLNEFKILDIKWVEKKNYKIDTDDYGNYYIIMNINKKFFNSLIPFGKKDYKVKVMDSNIDPYDEEQCKESAIYGELINFEFNSEGKNQLVIVKIKNNDINNLIKLEKLTELNSEYIVLALPRFLSSNEAYRRTIDEYRKGYGKDCTEILVDENSPDENMQYHDYEESASMIKLNKVYDNFVCNFLFSEFKYLTFRQRLEILLCLNERVGILEYLTDKEMIRLMTRLSKVKIYPKKQKIKPIVSQERLKGMPYKVRYDVEHLDLSSLTKQQYKELLNFCTTQLKK